MVNLPTTVKFKKCCGCNLHTGSVVIGIINFLTGSGVDYPYIVLAGIAVAIATVGAVHMTVVCIWSLVFFILLLVKNEDVVAISRAYAWLLFINIFVTLIGCIASIIAVRNTTTIVLVFGVAVTLLNLDSGIFQWCKKKECLNRRIYENFYKIEDLQSTNKSEPTWEIHVGMWSAFELFILLSARGSGFKRNVDSFYEFDLRVWHPRLHQARALSSISKYDGAQYVTGASAAFPQEQPWLLSWKEFRPFIIKVTKGGMGQNVSLEAPDGREILALRGADALDVRYVSFAAVRFAESKVFFDCPHFRYGSMQFLSKAVAPPLGRMAPPACRPERCEHCPALYLPVCAASQRAYRNECFFRCREGPDGRVLHKGVCYHWLWQM